MNRKRFVLLSLFFVFLGVILTNANSWKKTSNGWMYEQNGTYCYNTFIDDNGSTYYIDQNGYCAMNTWIQVNNGDWYYASTNGSLYKGVKKTINNSMYVFDDDGKLKKGWINSTYYANEKGYLVTGWQKLPVPKEDILKKSDSDTAWYYFKEDGQKLCATNEEYVVKTFDGHKYCFDQRGIMQIGWRQIRDTSPRIKGYMYFSELETNQFKYGEAINNTWYAAPSPEFANKSEEICWYYFNASAYPKCGSENNYQRVKIDNKYYLFDDYGNPVTGIRKSNGLYYFFGTDQNECSMKTGLKHIVDGSGSMNTYYFKENTGEGYTGIRDNKAFYMGRLQKADEGTKYQAFKINNTVYLVNTSGAVVKNKKNVKDADGNLWSTNSSGVVTKRDGGEICENILPEPNED